MNEELFHSILAMDSYNRGYGRGVQVPSTAGLGNAQILKDSEQRSIPKGESSNFYAIAYQWNGETIISYRGTDSSADFWGYGVGAGNPLNEYGTSYGEIVGLAVTFYQDVAGDGSDSFTANITTTGHSLGGGLAGYLAGLYGGRATIFDNMAFEAAATNTSELAADPSLLAGAALRDLVYGSSATTIPQADFSSINAYATTGEFLIVNRPAQSTPVEYLDTNGGNLNPIELHSMALQVALQYARVNAAEFSGWQIAASPLWDAFFEDAIADSLPGWAEFEGTKSGIDVIQIAIAYSAIDEGVRPFGDTAIRAMFNDARDFGAALNYAGGTASLLNASNAIGEAFVQFAGKLALGKVLGGSASPVAEGVLNISEDQLTLSINFSAALWSYGSLHSEIIGRDRLIGDVLSTAGSKGQGSDIQTGLTWLYPVSGISAIDRVQFATTNTPETRILPEIGGLGTTTAIFVAGDGDDHITGSNDNEVIAGGFGNDTIIGGAGRDIIIGGAGDDTLSGGLGQDFIAGGSGFDTLDLQLGTGLSADLSVEAIAAGTSDERTAIELTSAGDIDRLMDIEMVELTTLSDRVRILGDPDLFDGTGLTIGMGGDASDVLDASDASSGIYFNAGSGALVGLDQTSDRGFFGFLASSIGVAFERTDLTITGADTVIGSDFSDTLISSSGEETTELFGGDGNDLLIGRGASSQLWGGQGADLFQVGSNSVVRDGETRDSTYHGLRLFGGTQQWWMEGNTAYWTPFSTITNAFPVAGASLLTAASFFVDAVTMKFASYQLQNDGSLAIGFGFGLGGTAHIADYHLDLDSGAASGGVVVFRAALTENPTLDSFSQFVNLALKAGFGQGFRGWDPIVLDLDGDGYELTTQRNSGVHFEFDGDGFAEKTGWVRPDDGFLVLDANGNGIVDDSTEFFGDETQGGFAELATHDVNADGVIDVADAVFNDLRVWRDLDSDGETDAGELFTLAELGIQSISLVAAAPIDPINIGGNTIAAEALVTMTDGSTRMAGDAVLDISHIDTRYLGGTSVSAAAAALPELRGFGNVANLRAAMSEDAALLSQVEAFDQLATTDLALLKQSAEAILYAWAGVDGVAPDALGTDGFNMRKLAFLEAFSGQEIAPRDSATGEVLLDNLAELEASWADTLQSLTLRLIVQSDALPAFAGLTYRSDLDLIVLDGADSLKNVYSAILSGLSSDLTAALAEWESWGELLSAIQDASHRFDGNIVRADFAAAQLQAAIVASGTSLDIASLAPALGIDNLVVGTSAAETLVQGDDGTIFSGIGDGDTVNGGAGQDVYLLSRGFGAVTIYDEEGAQSGDRIRFVDIDRSEVSVERVGADLVLTVDATGDTVTIIGQFADVVPIGTDTLLSNNLGLEEIQFADGEVMETPDIAIAIGEGTSGDDVMEGTMHTDVFQGREGDDILSGGDDADLYVFDLGDGADIIRDFQTTPLLRAADMVIFGDDIAPEDLVFTRGTNPNDLVITIGTGGDSVTIEDQFGYLSLGYNDPLAPNSRIEVFSFRHYGDVYTHRDIQQMLIAAETTDGDDVTRGFGDDDVFGPSLGDDLLIGLDGNDTYYFARGFGNDTIDEQAIFIDIKVGLGGLSLVDGADTIVFAEGIDLSDVSFTRASSAPDLTITLDTGETMTVLNQFDGFQTGTLGSQWFDRIEWFEFADGTRISWQDVLLDITSGSDDDDSIWGDLYQDTLTGGLGNDYLSGGGYADTYIFNAGDGQDIIDDNNQFILGSGFVSVDTTPDIVRFGAGITSADISIITDGTNLTLAVGANGDTVTLFGQNDYYHTGVFGAISNSRIERIEFADGEVWTWQDLNRLAIEAATTSGDDVITGFAMEDRFEASAGDDIMRGGDSDDTYVFGIGSGSDRIEESVGDLNFSHFDVVEFGPGLTANDLTFERNGSDLIVRIIGTTDTLTIVDQFRNYIGFTNYDIELFRFEDGTEITKEAIMVQLLDATDGDDVIEGYHTDDTLSGGLGNDTLYGRDGSDRYEFNLGDGHDTIVESVRFANLDDSDRLVFGSGIAPSDIRLSRNGEDLIVSIDGTSDSVTIIGQFSYSLGFTWEDIEFFEFADGAVWTKRDVANFLMGGTSGDDIIDGTSENDELTGLGGNDILRGGDGSDTYYFNLGDGQDLIEEFVGHQFISDFDQIVFGPGITADDLNFVRDGNDLTLSIAGTTDSITIVNQFHMSSGFSNHDIEQIQFADGSVMTKTDIQNILTTGTEADETILGFNTDDHIDGGAGNDILRGLDGSDTYVFGYGSGNDIIRESVGNVLSADDDRILFGANIAQADVIWSRSGGDLIIGLVGSSDTITVEGGLEREGSTGWTWRDIERFEFADGTVLSREDVMAILLQGTAADETLEGFWIDDVLAGNGGNDVLHGGLGDDIYIFSRGDGQDTISDNGATVLGGGNDRLVFGPGILESELVLSRNASGSDIILTFTNSSDQITLANVAIDEASTIEVLEFADGTVLTYGDLVARVMIATPEDDALYGSSGGDTLSGGAGDDIIRSRDGSDVLTGGTGSDVLSGEGGDDIYRFALGDGQDTISEYLGGTSGGFDVIELGAGISPDDVTLGQADNGNDIVLTIGTNGDSITIDQAIVDSRYAIEEVRFADGTVWTHDDLLAGATGGSIGDDLLYGTVDAESFAGLAGNDTIRARQGNDTLIGGAGDDVLSGEAGDDTFVFEAGDGQDIIRDTVDVWAGGYGGFDTLSFGAGIDPADVVVSQADNGNDLVLTFAGSTDRITIDNAITDDRARIEEVLFTDGTVWTHAELLSRSMTATSGNDIFSGSEAVEFISGEAGDDTLRGRHGDDTLIGGTGNDLLSGEGGDDTFVFEVGDGQDIIRDTVDRFGGGHSGFDVLELGIGIDPNNVTVSQADNGNDLVLTFAGSTDRITIDNAITDTRNRIEEVQFADGTVWSHADLMARSMTPTSGNDIFHGSEAAEIIAGAGGDDTLGGRHGNDTIIGGTGNDLLSGEGGDDTFVFEVGDGQDIIRDTVDRFVGGHSGFDILQLGAGIDWTNVSVSQADNGNDLVLTFVGSTDRITIDNAITDIRNRIEEVHFAGGTVWSHADLMARSMTPTSGNDIFHGSEAAEIIAGAGGDDTLGGRHGNDTIIGETGNDLLSGEGGDDTFVFEVGDGQDIIRDTVDRFVGGHSGFDVLELGIGIDPANVMISQGDSGNDLVLTFAGSTDSITLDNAVTDSRNQIEEVHFADGTIWDHSYLVSLSIAPTSGDDVFYGTAGADSLSGGGGNDTLYGQDGNDILFGGTGDDWLDGGRHTDRAVYSGLSTDYSITTSGGAVYVTDDEAAIDGDDGVDRIISIETLEFQGGTTVGVTSPIILDLGGDGIQTVSASDSRASFDLDGDGIGDDTSWIGSRDGFLFLDRNGDGTMTGASEISFTDDVPGAPSDLAGLRAFDSNADGILSSDDEAFMAFGVWCDANGDGIVDEGETATLASLGIASIDLAGESVEARTGFGETAILNYGTFTLSNGTSLQFADAALTYFSGPQQLGARPDRMMDWRSNFGQDLQDFLAELRPEMLGELHPRVRRFVAEVDQLNGPQFEQSSFDLDAWFDAAHPNLVGSSLVGMPSYDLEAPQASARPVLIELETGMANFLGSDTWVV